MLKSKPFVIFLSAVAIASLVVLLLAWQTTRRYGNLRDHGIRVQGRIVKQSVGTGSRGYGQNHYFVYRFKDSRAQSHENQFIQNAPDSRLAVGQAIEILYDPVDPSQSIAAVMVPGNIHQPLFAAVKFIAAVLGVTIGVGALVFSILARPGKSAAE